MLITSMKTKRRRDLLHRSQLLKGLFTAQVLTSMMMFKFTLKPHLRISKTHLFTIAQYLLLMAAVIVTAILSPPMIGRKMFRKSHF